MTVELVDFIGFPDKITSKLKTHTEEGKIKVKSFEVKGRARPFIDGDDVINRLNEAFSHAWSDEVISQEMVGDEVIVQVRLCVAFPNGYVISHHGYGSGTPKGRDQILRSDLYKSAHTSAIKAAAKKFGIGLYMEESGFEEVKSAPKKPWTPRNEEVRPTPTPSPAPVVERKEEMVSLDFDPFADVVSSIAGNTAKKTFSVKPSDAQLNALHNMSRTLGVTTVEGQVELMTKALSESDLSDDEKEAPSNFSELSKRQASAVISYCVNQMDSKKKRA